MNREEKMKRVLLFIGKDHKLVWDASTTELAEQALLSLFKYLDEQWGFYGDLKQMQSLLYEKAKRGDAKAVKSLLSMRRAYEYEWWQFIDLEEAH